MRLIKTVFYGSLISSTLCAMEVSFSGVDEQQAIVLESKSGEYVPVAHALVKYSGAVAAYREAAKIFNGNLDAQRDTTVYTCKNFSSEALKILAQMIHTLETKIAEQEAGNERLFLRIQTEDCPIIKVNAQPLVHAILDKNYGYIHELLNLASYLDMPAFISMFASWYVYDLAHTKKMSKEHQLEKIEAENFDYQITQHLERFWCIVQQESDASLKKAEISLADYRATAVSPREAERWLLNLRYLELTSLNGLESIKNLKNVLIVRLHGNYLVDAPEYFYLMPHAQEIDLRRNCISRITLGALDSLTNLVELCLSHNVIQELESDVFKNLRSLTLLDLSHNSLKTLPPHLFDGTGRLKKLYLQGNDLDGELPVQELHNLLRLQITFCGSIEKLRRFTQSFTKLEVLRLYRLTHLTEEEFDLLQKALPVKDSLVVSIPSEDPTFGP